MARPHSRSWQNQDSELGMGNWEANSCSFSHAVSQWPPRGHGPISQMRTSEEEVSSLCNAIVSEWQVWGFRLGLPSRDGGLRQSLG